jgi:hypothetical protein
MFIGHFGVAFGAKKFVPRVSLGTLILASQFIDLLWPLLLLVGLEQVDIVPGVTTVTPLQFSHYPFSHSLLAVIGWGILIGGIHFYLKRSRFAALVVGFLVLSHWLLDTIVHRPDLPLYPGSNILIGFNAWSSLPLTLVIELSLFALGVWLYLRSTVATDNKGKWGLVVLVIFLLLVYLANIFGSPPPSSQAIAWVGQSQWLMVLWGYWLDRHRRSRF